MCRAGGRRCPGSNAKTKVALRQRISRARRAAAKARTAGDLDSAAAAEARMHAAQEALSALNATAGNDGQHVSTDENHDNRITVVNTIPGDNYGVQAGHITDVHTGRDRTAAAGGQSGDVTGPRTVVITSGGANFGVQAGVIDGGVEMSGGTIRIGGRPIAGRHTAAERTPSSPQAQPSARTGEHTAQGGEVTTDHNDDQHDDTGRSNDDSRKRQPVIIRGDLHVQGDFHAGPTFYTTAGESDDDTGPYTFIATNGGPNYGVQATVVTGDFVAGRPTRGRRTAVTPPMTPDPTGGKGAPPVAPYVPRDREEPRPTPAKGDHSQAVADATAAQNALRRFTRMSRKFPRPGR